MLEKENATEKNEIPGGKLYYHNDMVKLGCGECEGCSACCTKMGQSVVLTPWDVYQMVLHLKVSAGELFQNWVELHVEDGMIVPNLKMAGEDESCVFLNQEGRCKIHAFRPGICRLFPLGRQYKEDEIQYFLLEEACPKENKTKVKVKKWLDIPELKEYESFLAAWHSLQKAGKEKFMHCNDEEWNKNVNLYFLQNFFLRPLVDGENFYDVMQQRIKEARVLLEEK